MAALAAASHSSVDPRARVVPSSQVPTISIGSPRRSRISIRWISQRQSKSVGASAPARAVTTQSAYAYRTAALTDAGQRLSPTTPAPPSPLLAKPEPARGQPDNDGVRDSPAALLANAIEARR